MFRHVDAEITSPTILHYDAFSSVPHMGYPAGVVLDADELTADEMQDIANRIGFNETSFVMKSERADYQLRFFTPGHEMPLCGQGTLASTLALVERQQDTDSDFNFVFETSAGYIEVAYQVDTMTGKPTVSMMQTSARFIEFTGNRRKLTNGLGVQASDLHPELPIVYGNTGTWTLLVPMASLDSIRNMAPETSRFPDILTQMPRSSIHPFTLETIHPDSHMHARHFSSPYSGTINDPVTGTASGAMGAYMARYSPAFYPHKDKVAVIEQGFDAGRDGRVTVKVLSNTDPYLVRVTGSAVRIGEL